MASTQRLPAPDGTTVLVTGGNAGIGYFVAEQLAEAGATVLLGSRDATKAAAAMRSIGEHVPGARVRHFPMDLAALESSLDSLERLDALVCNAGVAFDDQRRRQTRDGRELMFATNHLGHFTLTALLAPLLSAAPAGRVVTTGSFVAKSAELDFADLQFTHGYQPKAAYARSKLAQMLFGFELDRRLRAAGLSTVSVVNHPGGALDSLTPSRPPVHSRTVATRLCGLPAGVFLQGKHAGAWPAVRAVLDPEVRGGQLWGPQVFGLRGKPRPEPVRGILADTALAAAVWDASVELTGGRPFGL
ncbi:SDR family NAD(P)-dependent oxidoreductase [Amycolatopsis jiangsuensis]|uniref:NAD(P)-dependent dehydrogenase (Short-subunit alcohol dehydrogenase family) n=1 Tax=Amycolatopsis jiangsuensis TaxID=1181879 RepID=A0A840IQ04_9PSEU|nr:SDR family NAD(P)-dependent oxidoreductase [Amycolatopsis jiangsuensis]MBB4683535.1 NAD(P)-dependent dehydrogenase (short-subunit alcohol dehydrogenase family) [Amycolatopsis jiangsuensis]